MTVSINERSDVDEFEEVRRSFLGVIPESLNAIENEILALEKNPSPELYIKHCRHAMSLLHSLKGAAGAHEFPVISQCAHSLEDQLHKVRKDDRKYSSEMFSAILKQLDLLRGYSIEYLKNDGNVDEALYRPGVVPVSGEKIDANALSVLIIENSRPVLSALSSALDRLGCKVTFCQSNTDGMKRILDGEACDLVVFSQVNAGIKGTTLAAVLALEMDFVRPRTVLLSSGKFPEAPTGMKPDFFLSKTPSIGDEIAGIAQEIQSKKKAMSSIRPLKTVFFIDDQEDVHKLARMAFKKQPDIAVTYFKSAGEAFKAMAMQKPDLVISDLQMPDISGREVLQEIGKIPSAERPVVFMLTGETRIEEIEDLKNLGAAMVFSKTVGFVATLSNLKTSWTGFLGKASTAVHGIAKEP